MVDLWDHESQSLRQAVASNPTDAVLWRRLGVAEQNAGRLDAAQEALERSLALVPGDLETMTWYAFLLNQRGQPQRAIEILREVLVQAPQLAAGWLVLAHASELVGDLAQAEAACRRALEIAPQQPHSLFQLAHVLFERGSVFASEAELRRLLAQQPQHA